MEHRVGLISRGGLSAIARKAKQVRRNFSDLHLLRAFCDAVPTMMPIDMLEGQMPRIPHAAVGLHREIRRLADQPIRPIVRHGDLIRNGHVMLLVKVPCRFVDEIADHFILGVRFGKRELDGLVRRKRLAPGDALLRVLHGFVDAVLGRANSRGGLSNTILVKEMLRALQASALLVNDCAGWNANIVERDLRVVGGHIEGPMIKVDVESLGIRGDEERRDAVRGSVFAGSPREYDVMRGAVQPAVEALHAVDDPLVAFPVSIGFHVGRVAAVVGFGDSKREPEFSREQVFDHRFLFVVAKIANHQDDGEVADDG